MRLCGEIDHWQSFIQSEQDSCVIAELAMGKLLCLKQEVMALARSKAPVLSYDLEYLVEIITGIEREMLTLFEATLTCRKKILTQLFDEIRMLIGQRLEQEIV